MADKNSSRRAYLSKLGAFGVAGFTGTGIGTGPVRGSPSSVNGDEVRYIAGYVHTNDDAIKNGAAPKKKPIYDTKPVEQFKRTRAARRAALRLQRKVNNRFDNPLVRVGFSTETTGKKLLVQRLTHEIPKVTREDSRGNKEFKIERVEPSVSKNQLATALPEQASAKVAVNGSASTYEMSVETEERTRMYTAEFDSTYRPVPGGCQIERKEDPGSANQATTACPIYHNNKSEWQILTCGHLFTQLSVIRLCPRNGIESFLPTASFDALKHL